ncbi:MAG: hypothetical protein M1608_06215, partial [Candidatus Omnitrophica bacterium]|nr:hypothetical protein [Candidatus Omnitrophota bacterium]
MRIYHPISLVLFLGLQLAAASTDYQFDGEISRAVLENYLARSVTFAELLHGIGNVDDNIRFLKNTGAKFAGRAIYRWGGEAGLPQLLERARPIAEKVHQADPDIIIQAACFEIVTRQVNQLTVPDWVFKEFGLTPENRQFRYEAMLYPEGQWGRDHWGKGASVPDMSQLETRMWFFYLAASYIDVGVEGIHFGQVEIMDNRDPDHAYWSDLLERVRRYAAGHARRHLVLCDAHVPSGGIVRNGRLLFDFHSFPLRIDEVVEHPQEGVLKMGYLDSLFGRSKGGITPSGWKCDHLPFLVELDNFEPSGHEGQNIGAHWIWGYDEICWFARQSEAYRNQWLGYAWDWIRQHDTNAWLEMPGSRTLAVPVNGKHWYWANTASPAVPDGFNQEETIKRIWASTPPATSAADSSSLNWPQFRGPEGNGHAHAERLPLTWTETQNVVWKTPIHDLGWSSPVVWGNQVWVTTATEDGKQMFAVRVDRDTGKVVHDVKVFDTENPLHVASVNSYASPTPVIEAGRLYVHFGTYGTACLDTANGRILWTRRDLNCDHHEG